MENKHPSKWTELPKGVRVKNYGLYKKLNTDLAPTDHVDWKANISVINEFIDNEYIALAFRGLKTVRIVSLELSNGWIWEAGGRGWRRKDDPPIKPKCADCNGNNCIDCEDEAWSCLDPDESPKPFIIPLREKIYGRDTHAALMAAHRKRQETKLTDEAHSLIRSICGDVLTYDGVEEK